MSRIIISDTTTLITLEKLQQLPLLCKLFQQVIIPTTVYEELLAGLRDDEQINSNRCIKVETVKASKQLDSLLLLLDQGEAGAIELANYHQLPIIIDEKKGRKIAQQLGLNITGFAGLLILSVRKEVISSQTAQRLLDSAIESGHRFSPLLYQQVTKLLSQM